MSLNFSTVSIPFNQGLDTKTDDKLVLPGKLINLENGVFKEGGKIKKRNGFNNLGTTNLADDSSFTSGEGLSTYKNELVLFANENLNTYSLTSGGWLERGDLKSIMLETNSIIDNNYTQNTQDMDVNSNLALYAWEDGRGGIRFTVQDLQTGARYINDTVLDANGDRPRVVSVQSWIYVFYRQASNLLAKRLTISTPTSIGGTITVKTDISSTNPNFDVQMLSENLLITYNDTSDEVHLFYFLPNSNVIGSVGTGHGNEVTFTGEEAENCLNLYILNPETNDPIIMIAYHNTANGGRVAGREKMLLEQFAPTTLDNDNIDRSDDFVDGDVNTGTDEITVTAHPFLSNDRVQLTTTGTLPTGLSLATDYFVIVQDANTIQLSLTSGPGAAVDITAAAGGGTHTATYQDPDVFHNITGIETTSNIVSWYYEVTGTVEHDTYVKSNTVSSTGTVGTASVFKRSVGLGLEAFTYNDEMYIGFVYDSTLQSTYFISELTSGTIMSRLHPSQAGGLTLRARLPRAHALGTDKMIFASQKKGRLQAEDGTFFNQPGVMSTAIDFNDESRYDTEQLGESLYIGGGQLFQYDGSTVGEMGFHIYPEDVTLTQSASGGSMSDGTYSFRAVYEWVDAKGQRHRSAPSPAVAITVNGGGSSQSVTATIPTLRLTEKSGVAIHLYSTVDSGTIYFRTTSVASPTFNDTTVDDITITRTDDDTTLIGNEILYTTGGIVENIAPPACSIVALHNNRIFLSGLEDPNEIWFSKEYVNGEAVSFNDSFLRRTEAEGGAITQLASMDDHLVIFKNSSIYRQSGSGPDPSGFGSDFTEPQLVATDVGCTDPRSVVLTDTGLMFKSDKGIYLLDRSFRVNYIGADVEAFNDCTITSAILMDGENEVRFTIRDNKALVYNYYFKQWSTWTNYSAEAAVVWLGNYTHLKSSGLVRMEQDGVFLDNGVSIYLLIETAWIKLKGLQDFQRIRGFSLLGEYKSDHVLNVSLLYDYEEYVRSIILFNATNVIVSNTYGSDTVYGDSSVYGGDGDNVYQLSVPHLPRQKCQAIKFRFQDDISGANAGESFTISDLTLNVGLKTGMAKLKPEKQL